ncbi:hypothetical protein KY289_013354 [Solanum tuberosum]|nr:hypothetical protein KY289_013354 [Solanum tuberosum]
MNCDCYVVDIRGSTVNSATLLGKNESISNTKEKGFESKQSSSAELANKFKIKREQLANERNDRAKKDQAPIRHKRKNSEDFIPQQGKSKLLGHKSVIQSSSRVELSTSHMIARKGQTKQRLFQSRESIQEKGIKLPTNNSRFQMSFKEGVAASVHVTGTTLGNGEKRKLTLIVVQKLIEYWKHPTVQVICEMNSQNRKKQKWRHRMGPINFARVRVALRAAKDNNEEPSKPEMFIATRTKTRKEIQVDTQVAIAELQNHQNSREITDDAFRAVFGKEQPGRLRCYGRSVTTSSLKKDEEINNLKQKHANEITSLKEELREEMRYLFTQLLQNNPGLNFQDIPGCFGSNLASPVDASSAQAVRGTNLPHSSGSDHNPVLQKVFCI